MSLDTLISVLALVIELIGLVIAAITLGLEIAQRKRRP